MNRKKGIVLWMVLLILLSISSSLSSVAAQGGDDCGCVRGTGYWKNHEWPAGTDPNSVLVGEGVTWGQALNPPPKGSPWLILAKAYVATMLNVAAGANPGCTADVTDLLIRVGTDWLHEPYAYSAHWHEGFMEDAQHLDAWNNGLLPGVPSCPDA